MARMRVWVDYKLKDDFAEQNDTRILTQNSQLYLDVPILSAARHLASIHSIVHTGHSGEPQITSTIHCHLAGILRCGREQHYIKVSKAFRAHIPLPVL